MSNINLQELVFEDIPVADIGRPNSLLAIENSNTVSNCTIIRRAGITNLESAYGQLVKYVGQKYLEMSPVIPSSNMAHKALGELADSGSISDRGELADLSKLYRDDDGSIYIRTKISGPVDDHEIVLPTPEYTHILLKNLGVEYDTDNINGLFPSSLPNLTVQLNKNTGEVWIIQDATVLCNTDLAPAIKKVLMRGK
jgi:hypothetical protein